MRAARDHRACWRVPALWLCGLAIGGPAWALDLASMWDFSQPAQTEQRFRAALASASGDDALILQTQIARTWGLRADFDRARQVLAEVAPALPTAGAEVRVRHALELGRSWSSAAHPPASQTEAARKNARTAFTQAHDEARAARLDGLAVDALHMMAFVDTAPADQIAWDRRALALAEASDQPAARRWEAPLRNNLGYALREAGQLEESLLQLRRALVLREAAGDADAIRSARWMVARTLRALGRLDEALDLQLQLERDWDAANDPDPEVFDELQALYTARGDATRAAHYAARRRALPGAGP